MNLQFQNLIDPTLPDAARVWVYQSNRIFSLSEALELENEIDTFTREWTSHGDQLKAAAHLFFGQFLVLIADETNASVSGCSTDKSVHFIQSIERKYGVQLMDRTTLAFVIKDTIQLLPMSQLPYAVENGFIGPATLYFNNLVTTVGQLKSEWIIASGHSWLAKRNSLLTINEKA
ncbi:MAG: hypothetical protein ACKO6Q_04230 [Bacteroidota bacterium]